MQNTLVCVCVCCVCVCVCVCGGGGGGGGGGGSILMVQLSGGKLVSGSHLFYLFSLYLFVIHSSN